MTAQLPRVAKRKRSNALEPVAKSLVSDESWVPTGTSLPPLVTKESDRYASEGKTELNALVFRTLERAMYRRICRHSARILILDGPNLRSTRHAISAGIEPSRITLVNDPSINAEEHLQVAAAIKAMGKNIKLVPKSLHGHLRDDCVTPYHLLFLDYNGWADRERDIALVFERQWFSLECCVLAIVGLNAREPLCPLESNAALGMKGALRHIAQLNRIVMSPIGNHHLQFLAHDDGRRLSNADSCAQGIYKGSSHNSHMWYAVHVFEAHQTVVSRLAEIKQRSDEEAQERLRAQQRCLQADREDRKLARDLERTLQSSRLQGCLRSKEERKSILDIMKDDVASMSEDLFSCLTNQTKLPSPIIQTIPQAINSEQLSPPALPRPTPLPSTLQ